MSSMREIAGLTAAGLTCVGGMAYLVAILRRTSTTRWSAWMIWTITSVTSLATYYASGARESIWVPVAYVAVCGAIFVAAVVRRSPGGLSKIEIVCLSGAALAAVIWWVSGSAVWGQVASVAIEMVAYVPIWLVARKENRTAWSLETCGSIINLLAVSQLTFGLLLYPIAILICNGTVVVLMLWPARVVQPEPEPELQRVAVLQ